MFVQTEFAPLFRRSYLVMPASRRPYITPPLSEVSCTTCSRDAESVIHLDPEIADGALQLRVAEKQLDRAEIAGVLVNLRRLGAAERVGTVSRAIQDLRGLPIGGQRGRTAASRGRGCFPNRLGNRYRVLWTPSAAGHSLIAPLRSVISNCTGRPVFCWINVARSRTLPPANASSTLNRPRSQPRSLLSIARLKMARSPRRPSNWRRTRMSQTPSASTLVPRFARPGGGGVFGGHGRLRSRTSGLRSALADT